MRRLVSVLILCFWAAMLTALVRRTWRPSAAPPVSAERVRPTPGEEWMAIYHQDQKIGYTHHHLSMESGGAEFSEESLLRMTVADQAQTVRTQMRGHLNHDFTLRDVDFDLSSGAGNLHAQAVVNGSELHLTLRTGTDVSEQVLPLTEPLFMPSTLQASLAVGALHAGQKIEALVFDPTSLKNDRMQVTVDAFEAVPHAQPSVQGWHVHEEFRGMITQAWLDASGNTLREEGPLGLVLVRQTSEQAMAEGWRGGTALDLVASAAVPVSRPIDDARQRRTLRLKLSGIALDQVPSDDEQVRDGAVLTITRPDLRALQSYVLPYHDGDHAADLAPTAFLQSDHPRVRAAMREALGDEHDALRAAVRLNHWVYGHLRKVVTVSIPNALQVLDMGEGDCNEHAVLMAALGRAAGLPSRVIAGAVYLDGAFYYHAWCEVWLGRWVPADPTFDQFPADATHVKFVVGGPEEHIAMLGIIGRLRIDVLDDAPKTHR